MKVLGVTDRLPSPLAGGEGGVLRSIAPRRRSRPAMQRGPWEGAFMPSRRPAGQTDGSGHVLSQQFDQLKDSE